MGMFDTNALATRQTGLSRGAAFAVGLLAVWTLWVSLTLVQGYVPLTTHGGDAAHLAALVLRLAEGETPHLDFMTPIGIASIWPIAALVQLGNGLGMAFLLAQAAFGALLLPALWWVGMTRFANHWLGAAFAALTLMIALAVTHGGVDPDISVSMHYNRWAWALSYIILAMILLPATRSAPRIDGLILGICFALLALIKASYFVGLAPAALLALALRRQGATAVWAVAAGCALAGVVTLAVGPAFWAAYLGDLLSVASSELRARPGVPIVTTLLGPLHIGGTLVMVAALILLSRAGLRTERWILLAVWPGVVVITWQNYGNEPLWLPIMMVVLAAWAQAERMRLPLMVLAGLAGALVLPLLVTLATSPARLAMFQEPSAPYLRAVPGHEDFRIAQSQLAPGPWATPSPLWEGPDVTTSWGARIPHCTQAATGMPMYFAMIDEVSEAGFAGRPAMMTTIIQTLWLFGDFPRLPGEAPWYYGNLTGFDAAEIVIVPLCPQAPRVREAILAELDAGGHVVTEVFRGDYAIVLEVVR